MDENGNTNEVIKEVNKELPVGVRDKILKSTSISVQSGIAFLCWSNIAFWL